MINILEPIYRPDQTLTEPSFTPYHHTSNDRFKDWREFRIYVEIYRKQLHKQHEYLGLFSPKFNLKTRLSGADFINFCKNHAGHDLYFINPFPQMKYLSYNIWMQAEANHPGIVKTAQNLLDAAGISIDLGQQPRHDEHTLAYSNFWVGTERFWNDFVGGVLDPMAAFIETNPDHPAVKHVFSNTFHTDPAPYLPFIAERMFTAFISIRPEIKKLSIALPPLDYCLNAEEKKYVERMMPLIDEADASKNFSPELRKKMQAYCEAGVAGARNYYKKNPHPHSGKTIQ